MLKTHTNWLRRLRGTALLWVPTRFFWANGGCIVIRFFLFYLIHLKVGKDELVNGRGFSSPGARSFTLKANPLGRPCSEPSTYYYPEDEFEADEIDGYKLVPLDETIILRREEHILL